MLARIYTALPPRYAATQQSVSMLAGRGAFNASVFYPLLMILLSSLDF